MQETADIFASLKIDPLNLLTGSGPKPDAAQLGQARALIGKAAAISPGDADVLYWRGIVAILDGDRMAAHKLLADAGRKDCAPYRATAASSDIVRRVAADTAVPLIDVAKLIEEKSSAGITCLDLATISDDWIGAPVDRSLPLRSSFDPKRQTGLFFDHCHLNYSGKIHALFHMADSIAEEFSHLLLP